MFRILKLRLRSHCPPVENEFVEPPPDPSAPIRGEIGKHLPVLQVLERQVQGVARQIEEAVVTVSSNFQQIAEQAKTGVARATLFLSGNSSGRSDSASVEDLIGHARSTFDTILSTLARGAQVSHQAVERMQEIDRYAERICNALKLLESIGDGNRILALNARIEAAHAGAYGRGFEAVATEVIAQTDHSHAVIIDLSDTIRSLRSSASSAVADLTRLSDQGMASAEEGRKHVEQTLQAFNQMDQQIRTLLRSAVDDSAQLGEEINGAVRGLQFQDRVNQRLNHVVEALNEVHARLIGLCGETPASDSGLVEEILTRYTMHEERSAADIHENEAAAGEVELF